MFLRIPDVIGHNHYLFGKKYANMQAKRTDESVVAVRLVLAIAANILSLFLSFHTSFHLLWTLF